MQPPLSAPPSAPPAAAVVVEESPYLPYLISSHFLAADAGSEDSLLTFPTIMHMDDTTTTTAPLSPPVAPHQSSSRNTRNPSYNTASSSSRKPLSIDTSFNKQQMQQRTQKMAAGPKSSTPALPQGPQLRSPADRDTRSPPPQSAPPVKRRRGEHLNVVHPDVGPFFRPTTQFNEIYSMDRTKRYTLRILPKIDRGFFLAQNDWTCYRRNYFQLSAAFTATDVFGEEVEMPALMKMGCEVPSSSSATSEFKTIEGFGICVSARVANGEKKIELVQQTAKRDKGPQIVPEPRPLLSGGNPYVPLENGKANSVLTFERMQFKTATANNGKRRAAQQYYVLLMDLYVYLSDGNCLRIATTESASLVVRGRSPGHYIDVQNERAGFAASTGAGGEEDADSDSNDYDNSRRTSSHSSSSDEFSSISVPPKTNNNSNRKRSSSSAAHRTTSTSISDNTTSSTSGVDTTVTSMSPVSPYPFNPYNVASTSPRHNSSSAVNSMLQPPQLTLPSQPPQLARQPPPISPMDHSDMHHHSHHQSAFFAPPQPQQHSSSSSSGVAALQQQLAQWGAHFHNGGNFQQSLHHHSVNASPDPSSSFLHHDMSSTFTDGSGSGSEPSILFDSSFLDPSLILTPVTPPGSTPSTPAIHQFVKNSSVGGGTINHQQQQQLHHLQQQHHQLLQQQQQHHYQQASVNSAVAAANNNSNSLFPQWVNEPLW